jgi:hypothetical protein
MKNTVLVCIIINSLSAVPLLGAAGIGGPVSGYVLDDSSHSLRPINGLPGSATLGDPVALPFPAGLAAASVSLDYALLARPRGGTVFLATGLRSGQPTVAPLTGAMTASGVVLSGSGTVAVLYSDGSHQLQFVSGLPASPVAAAPIDISQAGSVAAVAVDGPGSAALLLAADGTLYRVPSQAAGPQFIANISGASSVAILPDGTDAIVGNNATGDVLLVQNFPAASAISTLAGAAEGITSARDVAAVDAHHAAVIDGSGRLAVIDLDTAGVAWVALAGAAERFHALDTGLLLLNQPGPQALLLFASAQGGTAFFVPPAPNSNSRQGTAIWMRH